MKYFIVFLTVYMNDKPLSIIRYYHDKVYVNFIKVQNDVLNEFEDSGQIVDFVCITNVQEVTFEQYIHNMSNEQISKLNDDLINDFTSNIKIISIKEMSNLGIDLEMLDEHIQDRLSYDGVVDVDVSIATFIALRLNEYIQDEHLNPPNEYYRMLGINPFKNISHKEVIKVRNKFRSDVIQLIDFFGNYNINKYDTSELNEKFLKLSSFFTSLWK
mgnify:CR=1 FL=1